MLPIADVILIVFLFALTCSLAATPAARRVALRLGAVDYANASRKQHIRPVPRMGGVAIVVAFVAPIAALFVMDRSVGGVLQADNRMTMGLLAGGILIAALGVYDDLHGATPKTKFAIQFAVAGLMCLIGYRINAVTNPFGDPIRLGVFAIPFTMFWIAGIVNAINLMDGLDGLASGVALAALGTIFTFAAFEGNPVVMIVTASLAGAILGFLRYNFNPARIFMGDTGSMFIGLVLAVTAIRTHHKSTTAVAIIVPAVALGIPIGDTLLAIIRRAVRGLPIFRADGEHIHHKLLETGLSHRQAVFALYAVSLLLGIAALVLTYASGRGAACIVLLMGATGSVALVRLGYLRPKKLSAVFADRQRNLRLIGCMRRIGRELCNVQTAQEVWGPVKRAGEIVGARHVKLSLFRDDACGRPGLIQFLAGHHWPGPIGFKSSHTLCCAGQNFGILELVWTDGRSTLGRDTEIAVELLREHLAGAAGRIAGAPLASAVNAPQAWLNALRRVAIGGPHGGRSGTMPEPRGWFGRNRVRSRPSSPETAPNSGEEGVQAEGALAHRRSVVGHDSVVSGWLTTENILGFSVSTRSIAEHVRSILDWAKNGDRCRWLACMNPHSYVVSTENNRFREALRDADWLVPDGQGIVLASRMLKGSIRGRVTGSDVYEGVLQGLEAVGGSIFFLGSTEETLALIRDRIRVDYPHVRLAGTYAPPFKQRYTDSETRAMVGAINSAKPDVLWVGMTAPKQEVWLHENCQILNVRFAAAVGAVFDFYSGRVKRSAPVFRRYGLEWLPRLVRQPTRLWKRTLVSAPIFLVHTLKAALRLRLGYWRRRAHAGADPHATVIGWGKL